jgi:hypothetical protein
MMETNLCAQFANASLASFSKGNMDANVFLIGCIVAPSNIKVHPLLDGLTADTT